MIELRLSLLSLLTVTIIGCAWFNPEPEVIERVEVVAEPAGYPTNATYPESQLDELYKRDVTFCNRWVQSDDAPICPTRACAVELVKDCLRGKEWENI